RRTIPHPRCQCRAPAPTLSPAPFLAIVDYAGDNWLRCWFAGIDATRVPITMARTVEAWSTAMGEVFVELFRVVRRGGFVAFEVRSEEHTSELQSRENLVCRLLL